VAASCRPPRQTKSSPVFPVVGQPLQRHARHITSNGHSRQQSTGAEERELEGVGGLNYGSSVSRSEACAERGRLPRHRET
jgi:hypothetical protein